MDNNTTKDKDYLLQYQLFPRSFGITDEIKAVIACFQEHYEAIKSPEHNLNSDSVLKIIAADLKGLGFKVEESKAVWIRYKSLFYSKEITVLVNLLMPTL